MIKYLKRDEFINTLPPNCRDAMKNYLDNYITPFYIKRTNRKGEVQSANFPPHLWNYYSQVSLYSAFNTSTNPAEVVNRELKKFCPTGHISLHTACRKLASFKHWYVSQHESKVKGDRMNLRDKRTLERERKIKDIMIAFDAQTEEQRVFNLPEFCVRFGLANPNVDLIVETDDSDEIQNITISQTVQHSPEPQRTFTNL